MGAPRDNEYTGEREWSIDLTPNKESRKLLKELGISDRLREPKGKDDREETFMSFRHREFKADGTKADPIRVVDATNQPWDGGLIGNGTDAEVKFVVKDYGKGRKAGVYIRAVRILNLVPYVTQDFAPLDSDDEFFAGSADVPQAAEEGRLPEGMEPVVDELDDDIPE